MESNDSDRFIFREKRRCFRGRAKIFLDHLDYHGISSRGKVDEKHIDQLINVFRPEGCMRLHDPERYVPGLISSEELTRAVSYSKIRRLDLMQDGEPPILNVPDNLKIRVLHGEHRMRAAERFLEPREKWWVVMLYTPQLGVSTKDAIQEEYSHQLKFTDGEIYRNIRLHATRQDTRRVKKWEARLSSSKRDVLSSLDKRPNRPIRDGFNKSLPFSGLWDALKIGSLKRMLSLRCPEEFAHYLFRVYEIWEFFMQDLHLFGLIDPQTVNQLETLTPEASHDALLITKMMDKGEILPAVEDSITREEIKTRILQHRGRILSFNTFFDDWKYMEALVKSLRPLLPSGFQGSLRDEFSSIFRSDRLCPGQIKIQTGEHRYRIERSTSDQQKWLSYLMIFLAAMRDFPVLSQTAPRKSRGEEKPSIGGSPDERLSYLAQLAIEIGFKSEEIDHLVAADPDLAAARSFLRRSRPQDRYEIDERHAFILSRHIAGEIKLLATPLSGNLYPEFSSQLDNIPKQFRSGIPDNQSYRNDREHLYLDVIYNYNPYPRSHLTSLAFQRDIFVSYFGTMTLPGSSPPHESPPGGSDDRRDPSSQEAAYSFSNENGNSVDRGDLCQPSTIHGSVPLTTPDDANSISEARTVASPVGSSNYEAYHSDCSSRPMSDFPQYLRSIEAAIWPHGQRSESPQVEAKYDNIHSQLGLDPLAPGFERSLAKTMNVFHSLDSSIRPSDAAKTFLSAPDLIVVFLWNEATYIKFRQLSGQRWVFEEVMNLLADRDYCFIWIDGERVVVNDVNDIWAIGQEARLVFAGPKIGYMDEESKESFLNWVDDMAIREI